MCATFLMTSDSFHPRPVQKIAVGCINGTRKFIGSVFCFSRVASSIACMSKHSGLLRRVCR